MSFESVARDLERRRKANDIKKKCNRVSLRRNKSLGIEYLIRRMLKARHISTSNFHYAFGKFMVYCGITPSTKGEA